MVIEDSTTYEGLGENLYVPPAVMTNVEYPSSPAKAIWLVVLLITLTGTTMP